jgi:sugar phosphate isomerase/epimerase
LNQLSDGELRDFSKLLELSRIKCEVLCVLFPRTVSLAGDDVDMEIIRNYLTSTFKRLSVIKPEIIVFGSGASRNCPEGFSRDTAYEQLAESCGMIAALAEPYNITIALEPLNRAETNMINSTAEAARLINRVSLPNFKLVADLYHMQQENEPPSALDVCGDILIHTHIATKGLRESPASSDKDAFAPYFEALRTIGYNGRMSIEGRVGDMGDGLTESFNALRKWL